MLNARELLERGIVTGEITEDNISQVGIDLNLVKVRQVVNGGMVPKKGKTELPDYIDIPLDEGFYKLMPGVYDIELQQGCNIPSDVTLLIRQRSSLLRNGAIIHSSVFDPGFKTERMGTVLIVNAPIAIEHGARVCQIYGHSNTEVNSDDLYNGQFQNDKQRLDEKDNS